MRMHGLHGFNELAYFKDHSNAEIVVLLEEIFRSETQMKKIKQLEYELNRSTKKTELISG